MPELRQDPVTGRWVIFAPERSKRPSDFKAEAENKKSASCPFCPGHEQETPPEIMSYRRPGTERDTPGWSIRVVPNKFPALEAHVESWERQEGMFRTLNGVGAHEVLIETVEHEATFDELDREQRRQVIQSWRDRYVDLAGDQRFVYTQIFKNQGAKAGASLEHQHSQLISLPVLPAAVAEELNGARDYASRTSHCVFCDMLATEEYARVRMVQENQHFSAFCPHASRFPVEVWLLPRRHQPDFGSISSEEIQSLADLLHDVLGRLANAANRPPYNLMLHTAPYRGADATHYHWHLELAPRLNIQAGFEWGAGVFINPTTPEDAARSLREALPHREVARENAAGF